MVYLFFTTLKIECHSVGYPRGPRRLFEAVASAVALLF